MAKEYSSFLEYGHDSRQNGDEEPRPKHIVVAGQFAAALQQSFAVVPSASMVAACPQAFSMALKWATQLTDAVRMSSQQVRGT